jgi:hypothetical protein
VNAHDLKTKGGEDSMTFDSSVNEILDSDSVKKLVLTCGCAAILQVHDDATSTKGASFYFCNAHTNPAIEGDGGVVYDARVEKIEDPFGWDYKRYPGLKG